MACTMMIVARVLMGIMENEVYHSSSWWGIMRVAVMVAVLEVMLVLVGG